MPERDLAASLVECFGNDSVVASLRSMLAPIISEAVETAVAAAVAAKDAEIKTLREDLRNVTSQLNDLEQYSRRMCVNISGIPETTNEDAKQLHSDVTRPGGCRYSKNGMFQNINFNYLSVSEMFKASKDFLLSVKRQSVFRVYDSKVRCS